MKITDTKPFTFFREATQYIYFYLPKCKPCQKLTTGLLDIIDDPYYNLIEIHKFDISKDENLKLFNQLNLSKTVPVVLDCNYVKLKNIDQFKTNVSEHYIRNDIYDTPF